jgi:CheY-like chemotaxis protein
VSRDELPTHPENEVQHPSTVPSGPASGVMIPPPVEEKPEFGEFFGETVRKAAEAAARRTAVLFLDEVRGARAAVEVFVEEHRVAQVARVRADDRREHDFRVFCDQVRCELQSVRARLEEGHARFESNEQAISELSNELRRVVEVVSAEMIRNSRSNDRALVGYVVLLVEDEASMRRALVRLLEDQGARVLSSSSVEQAREQFSREEDRADTVVVDLLLEGSDGMVLVRELRLGYPEVGVVIASGALDDERREEARALGVEVLEKPYSAEALVRQIVEARARARDTSKKVP